MRTHRAATRRAVAWLSRKEPWQRGPWYWVPAFTLSVAFGVGIGATIGFMMRGLPYWLPLLGVAVAACLARALIDVQAEIDHDREGDPSSPPGRDPP